MKENYLRAACAAFMACANLGLPIRAAGANGSFVKLDSGDEYNLFMFYAPLGLRGTLRSAYGYGEKLTSILASGYRSDAEDAALLAEFDAWYAGHLRTAGEESLRLDYEDQGLQHVCVAFDAAWAARQQKDAA